MKGEKIRPFSGEKRKRRVKFEICGKNLLHFFENNVKYFRVNFLSGKEGKFAGFDYLRDNLKTDIDKMVQRELAFGIVDEVDSILIDEARTPLSLFIRGVSRK